MQSPAFVSKALPLRPAFRPGSSALCPRHAPGGWRMGRRSEKIKTRKDAQNQKRAKVFARIGKQITMAAKAGGSDPMTNKGLSDAIEAGKAVSFPKDTMDKAIARATSTDQADFKEGVFEAYGYGGAGIYIDVLTDNNNRASANIRTAINKSKMKIASPGSVAFNFERKGIVRVTADAVQDGDELLLAAIEAGAEECELDADESWYEVVTEPTDTMAARKALQDAGYEVEEALVEMVPKSRVEVSEEDMDLNLRGIEMLEALEDVDGVYTNAVMQ